MGLVDLLLSSILAQKATEHCTKELRAAPVHCEVWGHRLIQNPMSQGFSAQNTGNMVLGLYT